MIHIKLTSVMVDEQAAALEFYTKILGFIKKTDIPDIGWLTVVSPRSPEVELLLEPAASRPAQVYRKALIEAGTPWTAFAVDDLQQEYERMKGLGVSFRTKPTAMGNATIAVFDDTCGNLIQLYQTKQAR